MDILGTNKQTTKKAETAFRRSVSLRITRPIESYRNSCYPLRTTGDYVETFEALLLLFVGPPSVLSVRKVVEKSRAFGLFHAADNGFSSVMAKARNRYGGRIPSTVVRCGNCAGGALALHEK